MSLESKARIKNQDETRTAMFYMVSARATIFNVIRLLSSEEL